MSDDGDDYVPPPELPDGIKKEILTPAPSDCWKKPKKGDEVTVHYVGTLESDGSEFDSSRARDEPLKFTLGVGQVIQGWDKGVATMKEGEISKFTIAPEYAYGEEGSPPKIPANSSLVFEVELISWLSKDDLFEDEGVIKTTIKESSEGWKKPKNGDEVLISYKILLEDGSLKEEKSNLDYTLGASMAGELSRTIDKGLTTLKKGEECTLKCKPEYAYNDGKTVTVELGLEQIYETKDVAFTKDGSVMKKQMKEGG